MTRAIELFRVWILDNKLFAAVLIAAVLASLISGTTHLATRPPRDKDPE
jgi:hypothetical protein